MPYPWILLVALILSAGCSKQQYGQCEAPDEALKVLFKPKVPAQIFSHSFCVVCNTEIAPSEYADWALEMGASQVPDNPQDPCLYVYSQGPTDIDSLGQCQSLVCDGGAQYSDMANDGNGNFNLAPLLNGEAFSFNEEWILVEEEAVGTSGQDSAGFLFSDAQLQR